MHERKHKKWIKKQKGSGQKIQMKMRRKEDTMLTGNIYANMYIHKVHTYIYIYAEVVDTMHSTTPPHFALWRVPAPRANYDERFLHLLALIHLEN